MKIETNPKTGGLYWIRNAAVRRVKRAHERAAQRRRFRAKEPDYLN